MGIFHYLNYSNLSPPNDINSTSLTFCRWTVVTFACLLLEVFFALMWHQFTDNWGCLGTLKAAVSSWPCIMSVSLKRKDVWMAFLLSGEHSSVWALLTTSTSLKLSDRVSCYAFPVWTVQTSTIKRTSESLWGHSFPSLTWWITSITYCNDLFNSWREAAATFPAEPHHPSFVQLSIILSCFSEACWGWCWSSP